MNGKWISVRVITADIPGLISTITDAGIALCNLHQSDGLTVCFQIPLADLTAAERIAVKCGGKFSVAGRKKRSAYSWICRRIVLVAGVILVLAATVFLPTRILFVEVTGNSRIPTKEILAYAEQCGIGLGVSSRSIRSEQVKNRLLEELPQLQWVGVNTSGCVAVISVKERSAEENAIPEPPVSSMVAVRDGVILSCTATKGSLACSPGQAVRAGQVLISGYTDCGLTIRAGKSEGEVYAQTLHSLCVKVPLNWTCKSEEFRTEEKYSLILGKKRINFYKDSGILGATCDKMYTEYVLTLPGGFRLPVSVLVEKRVYRETQATGAAMQDMTAVAADTAHTYLNAQMVGGKITQSTYAERCEENVLVLDGVYRCVEMIGRIRGEEIIQYHGENN